MGAAVVHPVIYCPACLCGSQRQPVAAPMIFQADKSGKDTDWLFCYRCARCGYEELHNRKLEEHDA